MAAPIQPYVLLRDVIWMYSEASKQDDTKFLRLWRMAFRGFVQMGYNSFWQIVTMSLPVNDNRTVTLPDDYIIWTKVGQQIGNEIVTMRNNQNLLTATCNYEGIGDVVNSNYWFNGHTRCGCSCGRGNIEFKIVDGAILLNTDFEGDSLLLEYVGAPDQNDDYAIPFQFQEAMIDWLAWQDVKHIPATSHFGRGDKNDRALQFRASLKLAKKMYKPFRYSDLLPQRTEFNQGGWDGMNSSGSGSGGTTKTETFSFDYNTTGDEGNSVTLPVLKDKIILELFLDSYLLSKVDSQSDMTPNTYMFAPATSTLTFYNQMNSGQNIQGLYKLTA
jgi:hypothetical protein